MQKVAENPTVIENLQSRIYEVLELRHVQIQAIKKRNEIQR
jgi:uncharacterized protein YaaN involved in tellurite resistance